MEFNLIDSQLSDSDYIYDNMIGVSKSNLPRKFINKHIYVKDQKNSMKCVGFATSSLMEAIEMKRLGTENVPMLSPHYVYYQAKTLDGIKTSGTSLKAMAEAVVKYGICEASEYTEDSDLLVDMKKPSNEIVTKAKIRKADGYARVTTVDAIKTAIYQDCGVITSILYYASMLNPKKGYIDKPFPSSTKLGNHSTYWIGYDDDEQVFIQLNSYGESQGVFGLEYVPYAMIEDNWKGGIEGYGINKIFREAYVLYDKTNIVNNKFHINNQPDIIIKKAKPINMEFTVGSKVVAVDGKEVTMDVAPKTINGTNFVPFRFILEAMDCKVDYIKQTDGHDSIIGTDKNTAVKVSMNIGYTVAYVDNETYIMPQAPFIENGRTYVPIRAIGEMLGCRVGYDSKTKKITIVR